MAEQDAVTQPVEDVKTEPVADPYAELDDPAQREFVKLCDEQMGIDPRTAKFKPAARLTVYLNHNAALAQAKAPVRAADGDDEPTKPKKARVADRVDEDDEDKPLTARDLRAFQAELKAERERDRQAQTEQQRIAAFNSDLKEALKELDIKGDKARKFIEKTAKAEYLETGGTVPIGRLIKNATQEWKDVLKEENEQYVKGKLDSRSTRGEGSARTPAGEEVKFGGGKTIRDGMGQSQVTNRRGAVDTVITNALIVDHWGIVKGDIGIREGRIVAVGKPVPSRKRQLESAAAMSASCWSSFAISIGAAADSVVQL